jgi:hypothetical protein
MSDDKLSGMGRPNKAEPGDPLRIPRSVLRRIRRVASHKGQDAGDYVAEAIKPALDRDEAKMLADIARERQEEQRRAKGG